MMPGRLASFKFLLFLLVTGTNSNIGETISQFQNNGLNIENQNGISDVVALYDHERGVILYKDPEMQACLLEKADGPGEAESNLKILHIPDNVIGKKLKNSGEKQIVSTFQHEFCGNLPIVPMYAESMNSSAERIGGRKLKRVHRARRKRSENRHVFNTDYDQNGWPIPATQAQVQGTISGHGFFSGQAQSIANSMSQSQLQMGGVGITGSLSSSAGGAQAQLSLGSKTGSGQASNSGLGPSTSQVQVQLGEQQSGSNALANVIQHHSAAGGSGIQQQQQQRGGFGRSNFRSAVNNGGNYQQPQGQSYGGQYLQSGRGSQPQQQYFGSRGSQLSQADGQASGTLPQANFQQGTGFQGHSNGYPSQVPQKQFRQTGTQGSSNGYPLPQAQYQEDGRSVVLQLPLQQNIVPESLSRSNGQPAQIPQYPLGPHGHSNGYPAKVPQHSTQQTTGSQDLSSGQTARIPQLNIGSQGLPNGQPAQVPQLPISQNGRTVQQNLDSRGTQQYRPYVNGYPAQVPQNYGQQHTDTSFQTNGNSQAASRQQSTQTQRGTDGIPIGIPAGYTPQAQGQGNGRFTQSQQIYINGFRQNGQGNAGQQIQRGQGGSAQIQYPGTYASAPGGQAQSQSVVLQAQRGVSGGQTRNTNGFGFPQGDESLQYPTATSMLQTEASNFQGQTQANGRVTPLNTQGVLSYRPGPDQAYDTISHSTGHSQSGQVDFTEQGQSNGRVPYIPLRTQQNGFTVPQVHEQTRNDNLNAQGVYDRSASQASSDHASQQVNNGRTSYPTSQTPNILQQSFDQRSQQGEETRTNQYYPQLPSDVNTGYVPNYGRSNNGINTAYVPSYGRPNIPLQAQGQPVQQPQFEQPGIHGQTGTGGTGDEGPAKCHIVTFTCTVMFEPANGHRKLCRPKVQQNGSSQGQQLPVSSNSGICCC